MTEALLHSNQPDVRPRFNQRPLARALAIACLLAPLAASAATIQVTSNGNGIGAAGVCTLRSAGYALDGGAVSAACPTATGTFGVNDTITFAPGVTLINFDSYGGGISVPNQSRTIQGSGVGGVTLQRTGGANFGIITFSGGSGRTLTLDGITIEGGNRNGDGGGVAVNGYGGSITINNSIIRNNTSSGWGGGVYAGYGGRITINNSAITGNSAVFRGGGVIVYGGFDISNTTFSGNSSSGLGGGAFLSTWSSAGSVANTTFSGNTVTGSNGSGVYVEGLSGRTVQFRNNTVTANTGGNSGALLACYGGNIVLNSTIAWGNGTSDVSPASCTAATMTGANNLVGAVAGSGVFTGVTGTLTSNPMLAPLANNGGAILTHALLAGSPAINAGSNTGALTTDARGTGYARVVGPAADIGAFEFGAGAVVVVAPSYPVPATGLGALLASMIGVLVTAFGAMRRRRRE